MPGRFVRNGLILFAVMSKPRYLSTNKERGYAQYHAF